MALPIMPKATAVWLVDNTTLSFTQIATFCGMHELEVQGIADGEVATGIVGFDPLLNNQLTKEEITRCEADLNTHLVMKKGVFSSPERKRQSSRFIPMKRREEKPAAILWLVKNHPELTDGQISKLIGTTKHTIEALRNKTHWNYANITPLDPVGAGFCRQINLDAAIAKAAPKEEAAVPAEPEKTFLSPHESLAQDQDAQYDTLKDLSQIFSPKDPI